MAFIDARPPRKESSPERGTPPQAVAVLLDRSVRGEGADMGGVVTVCGLRDMSSSFIVIETAG